MMGGYVYVVMGYHPRRGYWPVRGFTTWGESAAFVDWAQVHAQEVEGGVYYSRQCVPLDGWSKDAEPTPRDRYELLHPVAGGEQDDG